MFVWGIFAVLTAIAAIAVIWPYGQGRNDIGGGGSDAEVYKDQLHEIDRDVARGAITESEAEAARLEVSRRLLKAADADEQKATGSVVGKTQNTLVLITAFVMIPLAALGIYLALGNPSLPDQPLAQRLSQSVENQDAAILIARVEAAVAENADDARGWSLLAPIYARQGRFFEARGAYIQLLRILGDEPALLTNLGEVIVVENQGLVTEEAMGRFLEALNIDPAFPKARYYRALGLVQEGNAEEARAILIALNNDGGPDAPWSQSVANLLADMDGAAQLGTGTQVASPNQQSAAAIASLPEAERRQAIEGMVEGLAARLEGQPDDLAGWSQLVRSYVTLGERALAQRALLTALDFFRTDNPARLRLLTIAEELQLETTP